MPGKSKTYKIRVQGNQPKNPVGKTRAKRIWGLNTKKVRAKLKG